MTIKHLLEFHSVPQKLSKDIEDIKKIQIKFLEMKTTVSEMKNLLDEINVAKENKLVKVDTVIETI